jgi:ABC-2 type transport system permease protein
MREIRTIIRKEWEDTLHNKLILSMLILVPVLMTAIAVGMLIAAKYGPVKASDMQEMSRMLANPIYASMSPQEAFQSLMSSQMMMLFLMMPLILPVTIAAYSIVGEKLTRSLEPLLATPITTMQLLLAKSYSSAAPAVGLTWVCFAIFLVCARFFAVSDRVFALFANPMWLIVMLLLVPLLTIMAVMVGIIVSSRVNDPRAAEQLGALVVIPFMGFFFAVLSGLIFLNATTFAIATLVVALLDVGLVYLGVGLFQRETILTRWK